MYAVKHYSMSPVSRMAFREISRTLLENQDVAAAKAIDITGFATFGAGNVRKQGVTRSNKWETANTTKDGGRVVRIIGRVIAARDIAAQRGALGELRMRNKSF